MTMKKHFTAIILASMLCSPVALAQTAYGGLSYGILSTDEIDTGNLGLVLGGYADNGFGFEFFYNFENVIRYPSLPVITFNALNL